MDKGILFANCPQKCGECNYSTTGFCTQSRKMLPDDLIRPEWCPIIRCNATEIISDVLKERKRQDEKWGEQNHSAPVWACIIGEEYGEVCNAVNEFGFNPTPENEQAIYNEAIQTMASCMAMLECMERARRKNIGEEMA